MIISVPRSWNLSQRSFVSRWHSVAKSSSQLHKIFVLVTGFSGAMSENRDQCLPLRIRSQKSRVTAFVIWVLVCWPFRHQSILQHLPRCRRLQKIPLGWENLLGMCCLEQRKGGYWRAALILYVEDAGEISEKHIRYYCAFDENGTTTRELFTEHYQRVFNIHRTLQR